MHTWPRIWRCCIIIAHLRILGKSGMQCHKLQWSYTCSTQQAIQIWFPLSIILTSHGYISLLVETTYERATTVPGAWLNVEFFLSNKVLLNSLHPAEKCMIKFNTPCKKWPPWLIIAECALSHKCIIIKIDTAWICWPFNHNMECIFYYYGSIGNDMHALITICTPMHCTYSYA